MMGWAGFERGRDDGEVRRRVGERKGRGGKEGERLVVVLEREGTEWGGGVGGESVCVKPYYNYNAIYQSLTPTSTKGYDPISS